MKKYKLNCVIQNKFISINKEFSSRSSAEEYALYVFNREYRDVEVDRIIERNDKHNLEYVCDNYNRFFISRVSL